MKTKYKYLIEVLAVNKYGDYDNDFVTVYADSDSIAKKEASMYLGVKDVMGIITKETVK